MLQFVKVNRTNTLRFYPDEVYTSHQRSKLCESLKYNDTNPEHIGEDLSVLDYVGRSIGSPSE